MDKQRKHFHWSMGLSVGNLHIVSIGDYRFGQLGNLNIAFLQYRNILDENIRCIEHRSKIDLMDISKSLCWG